MRLYKSLGIAAAAAQVFRGPPAGKTVYHGFGPGGCQNIPDIFLKNVAQGNAAVTVQAAGYYGAVTENTEMIPQAIAEETLPLNRGVLIRPLEALAPFQKQPVPDADTPGVFGPVSWQEASQTA